MTNFVVNLKAIQLKSLIFFFFKYQKQKLGIKKKESEMIMK